MSVAAAALATAGTLAALLGRTRPVVSGGLLALAAGELLLARNVLPEGISVAGGLALLAAGAPLLGLVAWLFVSYHASIVPATVAAAPLRWPFHVGSGAPFVKFAEGGALGRLVFLYVVVAGGGLALLWRLARGEEPRPLPPVLAVPAALLVALTVASLLWAYDERAAEQRLVYFVLPFVVLLAVVARAPFRAWLPRVLAIEAVALASLFVVVGLAERATRRLIFYDQKIAVANAYQSYFRTTSLFTDPSIYARHVAVVVAMVVVWLWLERVGLLGGAALVAFLFAGIYFSYSQSAMVALAAAVCLVSFLVVGRRARIAIATGVVLLFATGAATFGALVAAGHRPTRLTSGRTALVEDTWRLAVAHPLAGVGVASQPTATRKQVGGTVDARGVSHTAPLTVMAELGVGGAVLYIAFLAGAARLIWLVKGRDEVLGLSLLAAATVLFVHSLFYGVFFEDPLVWAVLGVAAAAWSRPAPVPREARVADARGRAVAAEW